MKPQKYYWKVFTKKGSRYYSHCSDRACTIEYKPDAWNLPFEGTKIFIFKTRQNARDFKKSCGFKRYSRPTKESCLSVVKKIEAQNPQELVSIKNIPSHYSFKMFWKLLMNNDSNFTFEEYFTWEPLPKGTLFADAIKMLN